MVLFCEPITVFGQLEASPKIKGIFIGFLPIVETSKNKCSVF